MIKIVKEHIGFHYLLTEIQLYTSIPLELNIFHKKYSTKPEINKLLTTYLQCKIMCGFNCIAFMEYVLAGKTLLAYTNFFSPNDYKK